MTRCGDCQTKVVGLCGIFGPLLHAVPIIVVHGLYNTKKMLSLNLGSRNFRIGEHSLMVSKCSTI